MSFCVQDSDKSWLRRSVQYSLYEPNLLMEQMDDLMYDSKGGGISFKILYTAIGFSSCTVLMIIVSCGCKFCKKNSKPIFELVLYLIWLTIWIPFTLCFMWTVTVSWSENVILSNYSRPVSWVLACGCCFVLTSFLLLDFFLVFMTNVRRSSSLSSSSPKLYKPGNVQSYYASRQARLAVSLNSVDLDADCENIKVL